MNKKHVIGYLATDRARATPSSLGRGRALIDQSSDLVLVVDRAAGVNFVSPSVERLLAFHDQDLFAGAPRAPFARLSLDPKEAQP